MIENRPSRRTFLSGLVAIFFLGFFILVNFYFSYQDSHQLPGPGAGNERENLPAFSAGTGKRLAFHDFESGSALDTASHLSFPGHTGKQSLKMNSRVNFSPGLWIKFKDLNLADSQFMRPGDAANPEENEQKHVPGPKNPVNRIDADKRENSSWIRATGYVWFSCAPSDVKCYLVATCNHNGVNYKYMYTDLETAGLQLNEWNRVTIDYRLPPPVKSDDVLQAYFWYRGMGEMLVDDIEITLFAKGEKQ